MIKNKDVIRINNIYEEIYKLICNIFFMVVVSVISFIIFKRPDIISKGVAKGINICIDVIIPSLFPFMVICNFISLSPMMFIISKLLNPLTRIIFNLPANIGYVIFISLIGGYPMGAKIISDLIHRQYITENLANRLLCFCVNAGPAFVITAIGYMVYGSRKIGVYLLISHLLGSIIIGALLGLTSKDNKKIKYDNFYIEPLKYSQAFVKSVVDSSYGILNISSFVVVFSVITILVKYYLGNSKITNILLSFLEITVGIKETIDLNGVSSILLCIFLISFSGVSVICQILYFIKDCNLDKTKFFLFRIIHGLISVAIMYLILIISKDTKYTSVTLCNNEAELFNVSPFLSVVVFLLSVCFIIFSYNEFFEENNNKDIS